MPHGTNTGRTKLDIRIANAEGAMQAAQHREAEVRAENAELRQQLADLTGPLSAQIDAALGTDDWLIVSASRPLGHELITADELDDYASTGPAEPAVCRGCGCTDTDCSTCIELTGHPCHWVEPDLCSACAETEGARRG